jgi:thiazole synthase
LAAADRLHRLPELANNSMNIKTYDSADPLIIAGKSYGSRLLTGTGKYKDFDETRRASQAAGAEIVTVAIRRVNLGQEAGQPNLLEIGRAHV